MRLGKRGMEDKLTFIMWEMIVILLVVSVLTLSVNGIANNNTYWKKYHATDLALMTDLLYVNDGEFEINYDMKEIRPNIATKIMMIKPLIFMTALKDSSYFVYDKSPSEDRFPQSYIFAQSPGIKIIVSNSTGDYLTLYKYGSDIGIKSNALAQPQISCSAIDTTADISSKDFKAIDIAAEKPSYGPFVSNSLDTLGTGSEKELLIGIMTNKEGRFVTYYDASSKDAGKSEKMSCLVRKNIAKAYQDSAIETSQEQYGTEFDSTSFISDKDEYMYSIAVNVNESVSPKELSDILRNAINEYYGTNN